MAETTGIELCDSTFNPWIGCTKVSPGCARCYAEVSTPARTMGIAWGAGQRRHRTATATWKQPVQWNAEHAAFEQQHGRRRRVFCASLADWLDNEVPIPWLADLLELIRTTPQLDWLLLSKRIGNWSARVAEVIGYLDEQTPPAWPLPLRAWLAHWLDGDDVPAHVWLGATIVDQEEYDRDAWKLLMRTKARVRFLSIEPMLGPVFGSPSIGAFDWVICGGESGHHARPIQREWVQSLRDQCSWYGVPFFFKQWGGRTATAGGCAIDGAEVKDWPCPR